jgi:hypothetical protein
MHKLFLEHSLFRVKIIILSLETFSEVTVQYTTCLFPNPFPTFKHQLKKHKLTRKAIKFHCHIPKDSSKITKQNNLNIQLFHLFEKLTMKISKRTKLINKVIKFGNLQWWKIEKSIKWNSQKRNEKFKIVVIN